MDWAADSIAIRRNSIDHVGIGDQRGIGSDKLPVYAFQSLVAHLKLGILNNRSPQAIDIGPGSRGGIHEIGACLETRDDIRGIPVTQTDLDGDGLEEIARLEGPQLKGQATAPGCRALVDELL
jgi:hypothetical protein